MSQNYTYSKSKKPSYASGSSNKSSNNASPYKKKEPKENYEPITSEGVYLYDKDYTHFVVHCSKSPYNEYIGRFNPKFPSTNNYKFGNPFVVGKDGDRNTVVKKYRDWIFSPEQNDLFNAAKELKGKILACWCSPMNCHGYVLAEIANSSITNKSEQQLETSSQQPQQYPPSPQPPQQPPQQPQQQQQQQQSKIQTRSSTKSNPDFKKPLFDDDDFPPLGKKNIWETLEYIKKAKDLKNLSTKDHNNFKDPMILLTSTIKLRKITANYYCIPESSLPNIISFDQFI
ncbi:hypothetical protein ACTFIV_002067 [Dictyostelium citrinum]